MEPAARAAPASMKASKGNKEKQKKQPAPPSSRSAARLQAAAGAGEAGRAKRSAVNRESTGVASTSQSQNPLLESPRSGHPRPPTTAETVVSPPQLG